VAALCPSLTATGQVTLDGTTGPAATLAGPNYTVGADVGQLRGPNLFHSFGRLDVGAGESLTFTGPSSVRNVAARVTGGTPSTIAGTLRVGIAGANLLLVNPAGVAFRAGAQVDVGGSVVVTTADFVGLADGGRFDAARPGESVLTAAAPSAFGFVAPDPGPVELDGAGIGVQPGRVLSVVGGDVRLRAGTLFAGGGGVNVVATRGPARVTLDPESVAAPVDLAGAAGRGDVSLLDGSQVNVDSAAGNRVVIRGGNLTVDGSSVSAQTFGATDGGGIDVRLSGDMTLRGGTVDTSSQGAGLGGDIDIRAHGVTVDGRSVASPATSVRSEPGGPGVRGGSVRITTTPGDATGFVRVLDAGQVSTTSFGAAAGGDIRVESPTVVLDGTRAARVEQAVTGLVARTVAAPGGGPGGDVEVVATGPVEVIGGAVISADTFGSGDGGDVTVRAGRLLIDGRVSALGPFAPPARPPFTGVAAGSFGGEFVDGEPVAGRTFGAAGKLDVEVAGDVILRDGASLASAAFLADADDVTVRAGGDIALAGRSRITAESGGEGGNIRIEAGGRFRSDDSVVITQAVDPLAGAAGDIDFNPAAAVLNRSVLRADAVAENAGNIRTATDAFVTSPDTVLSAQSQNAAAGAVDRPEVDIAAGLVRLPGSLFDDAARLEALCGMRLGLESSSFIQTGRGGAPAAPGGWAASLEPAPARRAR
jgi:filamentous hemagglutinin family protein